MYAISDAIVSALSLVTLCYLLYAVRIPFKKHHMNIFSHLMLILLVFSLISKYHFTNYKPSKSLNIYIFIHIVRSLFFLTHLDQFKY